MVRRNFLALLQGWHRITLSDNRHVVHKLACLLFQAGAPVRRGESQDVKISSDYFDKVINSEQSPHLGKRYVIALADGSGCYASFQTRDLTNLFFALVRLRVMCKTCPSSHCRRPLTSYFNRP